MSGNPRGKQGNRALRDALFADLERCEGSTGKRRLEMLAERLGDLALSGDPVALRLVVDRLWPAKLELSHEGGVTARIIDLSSDRAGAPGDFEPTEPGVLDLREAPRELPSPVAPIAETAPTPPPSPAPITLRRPDESVLQLYADLD